MTRLIVMDCTPYGAEPSGSRRRAEEILRRLPALLPDDVIEAHWARDGGGPAADVHADNLVHATVDVSCKGGLRRWWQRGRDLRRRLQEAAYSHLLSDHGPVVAPARVRNLVTLHDLRFLHGYGGVLRSFYGRTCYGRALRRAAVVLAVAPSLGAEAQARFRLDPTRVVIASNAVSPAFEPDPTATRQGVLVVSRDEPRKARGAALAAARAAGLEIVVVDAVRDDAELRRHYASASWLLAPSLHEGYGMTVAEALACGTPVIATDHAAHRDIEALGARGIGFVPPPTRTADGWPEAVRLLQGAPPRDLQAPTWTWDDAARTLAAAIVGSDTCGEGPRPALG